MVVIYIRRFGCLSSLLVGVSVNGGARPPASFHKAKKEARALKVKCIKKYNDKKLKRLVEVEEVIDVTAERGKELIIAKVAVEIEEEKKKRASKKEA